MKSQMVLEMSDVKRALSAAEQEASNNGWAVSIAVCDAGGIPMGLLRMDKAASMSSVAAPEKARTSVMTRKPTAAFEGMLSEGRVALMTMDVMLLEGGEPIVVDGEVIGAVGVSGVHAEADSQIARAGVAAILAGA